MKPVKPIKPGDIDYSQSSFNPENANAGSLIAALIDGDLPPDFDCTGIYLVPSSRFETRGHSRLDPCLD
jgi:hypothetical protein